MAPFSDGVFIIKFGQNDTLPNPDSFVTREHYYEAARTYKGTYHLYAGHQSDCA